MRQLRFLVALTLVLFTAGAARAADLAPYKLSLQVGSAMYTLADLYNAGIVEYAHSSQGGTYTAGIPGTSTGIFGDLDWWQSSYDFDPSVTNAFAVTNSSAVTQTYIVTVTSPVVPQTPSTTMGGSIGLTISEGSIGGTATADNFVPNAVYTALIDGGPVQTLWPAAPPGAFLLTCTSRLPLQH